MFSWILALLLALIAFSLSAAYLWLVKRRRKEMSLGLQALAGMHWRDFSELVRRALREQRGLLDVPSGEEQAHGPRSDFLLADGTDQWLISCKHGLAYRIGTAAINELGAAARLAGARGGILITEGRVEGDGLATAGKQSVELLDGPRLWPLLLPYLPGDIESSVRRTARREATRRTLIAALAASTLGLLVGLGYQTAQLEPDPSPAEVRAALQRATLPATPPEPEPEPAPAAATPAAPSIAAPPAAELAQHELNPDQATLDRYQQELARSLARIPGVASGFWQTRQTLAVNRTGEIDSIWPLICGEVMRYPALRTVRIQLNARPGVDEPVRWRQCTTL